VDCISFIVMRQLNLKTAFACDRDFAAQGFETLA
jgi:predicted nucleic acid-binding protein